MTTFGAMRARIADEIGDVDEAEFTVQIKRAIVDAIEHHERTRWWFNERVSTFSTVAATEAYAWPNNQLTIDTLKVTVSAEPYTLIQRDWKTFDDLRVSAGQSSGSPVDWSIYGDQIYLYPIPEQVYTITYSGLYRPATILTVDSDDADTNVWMTDGAQLIRHRAKMIVARDVLRDPELAALAGSAEIEAERRLRRDTTRRLSTGRIRSYGSTSWH